MKSYFEEKRPTMYRTMKYWGKKPHNIWGELIRENTNPNDIVLDPFSGSGVAFFESIKIGRKPIAIDINPLSSFIINVYSEKYDTKVINEISKILIDKVKDLDMYKENYVVNCSNCDQDTDLYNYVWENNEIISKSYKCSFCKKTLTDNHEYVPSNRDVEDLNYWKPSFDLSRLSSISKTTLKKFGGNDFSYLWTKRNFQLLSFLFKLINELEEPYKKIFVFAFLQTLHLTTKMCSVRGKNANRPLSTSWGRPAYMALSKYMEQNPIIQFERALYGNSGVINAIKSKDLHLGETYSFNNIISSEFESLVINDNFLDVKDLPQVDFIITDPPYGSTIQYGELSLIWNLWLVRAYPEFTINLEDEIIINKSKSEEKYAQQLLKVFNKSYEILKDNGKMIFTFNSNKQEDWLIIKYVLQHINFNISNVHLQLNKRSSEANVAAKSGMAISDYYIVLKKTGQPQDKAKILSDMRKMIIENE